MAGNDVSSALRRFTDAANRLNTESDSVNETLAGIEAQLVDANVGLEVWLRQPLTSTDPTGDAYDRSWTATRLGFAKIGGEWCLAVKPTRFDAGFFEGDSACPYEEEYADGEPTRFVHVDSSGVPDHAELRIGTLLSIIRQSGLPRTLFEH